ncbi:hypothetical protein CHS0354_040494 [Potamilus streckersoni]|uniref:Uncharacterized protein n=1 Tax=Potamilus streckersoni TaxID=2493646 RepID=A0AAE0WGB2_9BIVA|nr:hypothetical protein CHS0354_040494 [Potamilus streckersoni]
MRRDICKIIKRISDHSTQYILELWDDNSIYPNGFAVDSSTGNIYYTAVTYTEYVTRVQSHIGVLLPNGKHKVILTRLNFPHGLVVYPSKGLLFYINIGPKTYIGRANMDGTQASVLLDISNDRWPIELTIDYKMRTNDPELVVAFDSYNVGI